MRQSSLFNPTEILPNEKDILKHQGIPEEHTPSTRIQNILSEAIILFIGEAKPQWIRAQVSRSEFKAIYLGAGENFIENPLENIYSQASNLALFALTVGLEISNKIENLFQQKEYALAAMLDSVASTAAENAVARCEKLYEESLQKADESATVLAYSPGYCGWHISGQKKLFDYLKPEQIGITINNHFLMTPLKSVSGLLVAGPPKIHLFKNNFDFCRSCTDKSCTERMWKINHPEEKNSEIRRTNGITTADFSQSSAG
ncbi:MAG: hypothetical protein HN729_06515 [Candidatus Marinimicrobia bacterium]|nr:hypothetical protein [Candidatus Neomarinimicrobiota bacterium]MBT6217683.1 hypothetical protein [Candidatus Neomarinimicrobiota bacterium]MBT7940461.1 hypothetical protein [Candidatus Neomarinimicrobiota bacterium]